MGDGLQLCLHQTDGIDVGFFEWPIDGYGLDQIGGHDNWSDVEGSLGVFTDDREECKEIAAALREVVDALDPPS